MCVIVYSVQFFHIFPFVEKILTAYFPCNINHCLLSSWSLCIFDHWLFAGECEHFITAVDFSVHIRSLSTGQHLVANETVAFCLHLAGHFAGRLSPMPISNQEFANAVDMLFDKVVESDALWSQPCIRAAWLIGLQNAVADGHPNNRSWLSSHGKRLLNTVNKFD